MGMGFDLRCPECGYEKGVNAGVGFLFPKVYQEAMEAAKAGKLGKTVKQFLEEHPEGVLNTESVLLQCTECGVLKPGMDLSMYVPKPGVSYRDHGPWSVLDPFEDEKYVAPMDLRKGKDYQLYGYGNICHKCGKPMQSITQDILAEMALSAQNPGYPDVIPCPRCKAPLTVVHTLMWD